MTEYVRRSNDEPSYSPEEAKRLDFLMDEVYDFCEKQIIDIYELTMGICKDLHGDIFAEKEVA